MAKSIPKARRQGSPSASTRIPIFSLSGGVSSQAESKRLPTEAQILDNALISLEKSFEKRPGFITLPNDLFTNDLFYSTQTATFTRSTNIVTVTLNNHNYKLSDIVYINFDDNAITDGDYKILSVTTNTFTVQTVSTGSKTSTPCTVLATNTVPTSQRLDLNYLEIDSTLKSATYSHTGSSITITLNNHNLLVGNSVDLTFTSSSNTNSTYKIVSRTTNTFTVASKIGSIVGTETGSCSYVKDTDYYYYWLNINNENCFLVVIDYSSSYESDALYQKLLYVFKINKDTSTWTNLTPDDQSSSVISVKTRNYITYNNDISYAKDILKISTIGTDLIILNTKVKAGFTSDEDGFTFNLAGIKTATQDIDGKKIVYYTAAKYTHGEDGNWYVNTLNPTSSTIKGTVDTGNTITLTAQPELPNPVTHGKAFQIKKVVPSIIEFSNVTNISITGSGFTSPCTVTVGANTKCTNVLVLTPELITCTVPNITNSSTSTYNVTISTPAGGTSTLTNGLTVSTQTSASWVRTVAAIPLLQITTVAAHGCIAGNYVYIQPGSNLLGLDATTYYYKVNQLISTTVFNVVPVGSLTNSTGSLVFTKVPQIITSVFPTTAVTSSTTLLIITGERFINSNANIVKIGTTQATSVTWKSETEMSCTIPSGIRPGTYDISLTNATYNTSYTVKNIIEIKEFDAGTTVTEVRPHKKNKFYAIIDINNYAVLDGWSNETTQYGIGTKYNVVSVKGSVPDNSTVNVYSGYFPEVADLVWNDIAHKHLGQSMADFSEISFPPEAADASANNGLVIVDPNYFEATYTKSANTITITTSTAHGLVAGNSVAFTLYNGDVIDTALTGRYNVATKISSVSFTITSSISSTVSTPTKVTFYNTAEVFTLDNNAKNMLASLYPLDGPIINGAATGMGKIYYCASPYLSFTNGYYRIISSVTQPYTKKVRSPDLFSVVDKNRMPQKITIDYSSATPVTAKPVEWTPKTSGDRYTNPGPSIFLTSDLKTTQQVCINSITTFRDRLYLCAKDVLFTSRIGEYENLFIEDSSNITASDPIDIRASSTSYNEIKTLTPFNNFLFLTTYGNVQYELKGSVNQITPLTAEISPTAFYSTLTTTEPQTLGTFIYFLDSSKLFLYISTENKELAIAQELTASCYNYLPKVHQFIITAPAQNTLIISDADNLNHLYFNISRFASDKNIQNAFYRYLLNNNDSIYTAQVFNDYMYTVNKRSTTTVLSNNDTTLTGTPDGASVNKLDRFYLEKVKMSTDDSSIPRLDRMISFKLTSKNSIYNALLNTTVIKVPLSVAYSSIQDYVLVLKDGWENSYDQLGHSINRINEVAIPTSYKIFTNHIELTFAGSYVPLKLESGLISVDYTQNCYVTFGIKYLMTVELSKQFVRDQNNNVIDGVLNLKKIICRHKQSGNYDLGIQVSGRDMRTYTFSNHKIGSMSSTLSLNSFEEDGKFQVDILGYADNTKIKVLSNYITPLNIVNFEIYGKFIQKQTGIIT